MGTEIRNLSDKVAVELRRQGRRFGRASLFVKVVLVSLFSAVSAVAQFVQAPLDQLTSIQIVGIIASLIVAIGGVFVIITEENATVQLGLAQESLEAAKQAEEVYGLVEVLQDEINRLIELYQAMHVMRGAVECLPAIDTLDEDVVAAKILKVGERSLTIAMGFAQHEQWTIGIYKAVPCTKELNRALLKCIAHKRAIECEPSEARVWKEGTGIMGVAYANGDEIIVPDLQAEGMRAVFGTSANEPRDYDADRYRSMVAVPIKVDGLEKPWGVVTATNDRVGHFTATAVDGVRPDEGARALAGMIALAIAVIRKKGNGNIKG